MYVSGFQSEEGVVYVSGFQSEEGVVYVSGFQSEEGVVYVSGFQSEQSKESIVVYTLECTLIMFYCWCLLTVDLDKVWSVRSRSLISRSLCWS